MVIYRNIDEINRDNSTVISVGTFDGVHCAHRQIIKKVLELSTRKNFRSLLVTFDPHPQEVLLNKTPQIKLLSTTVEKLQLFDELSVDNVLVISFTKEFSKTTAREFYEKYIYEKIGISDLVVGYDHGFGRNREGDFQMLKSIGKEFSFKVHRVDEIDIDDVKVSSTNIRNLLTTGNIEIANSMLGYSYGLEAKVVGGDKIGRELGFPTANLEPIASNKVIPGDGVYAVKVILKGNEYYGMVNIGYRPTVSVDSKRIIEVNIFDFSGDIYGNNLIVRFASRLRDELKFGSKDELINQLKIDKENTIKILGVKK